MKEVFASIITIGDELLIGQTIDTNSAYIAQELNKIGIWVKRRVAIGDGRQEILDSLAAESRQAQVVIITGGLGPTADDITKPTLCDYFGGTMIVDAGALQNVVQIFERLGRPMFDRNRKQAEVPDTCVVLPNLRGTAPGMWFEKEGTVYISLPGVPHEMIGLMQSSVLPKLKTTFELPVILHRSLLTAGKGESEVAEILLQFEAQLPNNVKLAYLPSYGMVKLRLTAKGSTETEVAPVLEQQFSALQQLVQQWLVVAEDIPLQEAVLNLLKEKGKTVATAESCTGGYLAHLITAIPGSSAVYQGSVISYANSVKEGLLGVPAETLATVGAVSEATVTQMARGVQQQVGTDYAIATSGIMGPDGGTADKPVGTVWIAVANRQEVRTRKFQFRFDRKRNIELTAVNALNMLRQLVVETA
ncbi:nicotinamide-nucleotide amidase [Cnuella takakiae]|uniref:CinA-like protein n=1 Tax=Cnuella takakiae TaxID=1302690 RepID=A0A1M5G602_9BACT|nr:competence/damage-inducible protein A [Cnuella takakiae]OLY92343.1 competence/damage-inducible protein A [Cnuella takakiae]SHF99139.1 nicotinamide-nucleotide amidase [Cnuella takakiae]